jgi:hypothetical protein
MEAVMPLVTRDSLARAASYRLTSLEVPKTFGPALIGGAFLMSGAGR